MSGPISTRLPGVPLLPPNASGSEYSRWRRGVEFALESRGLWKYCTGEAPMPMPPARPSSTLPRSIEDPANTSSQPSLFEERRAWVRRDREAKLDIYLSLTEDTMLELFDVGPPLPPSSLSAQEMMEALDEHFTAYKFEAYHHAFCHFLNLHIDQFPTVADFNAEYLATLEDLVDYGHPLSNTQACSAYFSKMRCTQNPWVVKMLDEWDSQPSEPQLLDLLEESPQWAPIRPLSLGTPPKSCADSSLDDTLERNPASSNTKAATESPYAATFSSQPSHSSKMSIRTAQSQGIAANDAPVEMEHIDQTINSMVLDLAQLPRSTTKPAITTTRTTLLRRMDSNMSSSTTRSMLERALPDRQADLDIPLPMRARSASPRFPGNTNHDLATSRPPIPNTPPQPPPAASLPTPSTPSHPPIDPPTTTETTTSPLALSQSHSTPKPSKSNPNLRPSSAASSIISLPIQGIRSSSWDYTAPAPAPTPAPTAPPPAPPSPPPKATPHYIHPFAQATALTPRASPPHDDLVSPKTKGPFRDSMPDAMYTRNGSGAGPDMAHATQKRTDKKWLSSGSKKILGVNMSFSRFT